MLRHTATTARKHFSDLLDAAEAGEAVFVERRGRTFKLELIRPDAPAPAREPLFTVDESLLEGQWNFDAEGNFTLGSS
ncbi:hypothetical protein LBMAG42_11920 [Deltaproteobacteria bacterium]|nr:hypothetical protein LBMAG42_11920 [Deltaproteobacteria bacterium]